MPKGVKVWIKNKTDNIDELNKYGYIIRRLNVHFYEIEPEVKQTNEDTVILHKDDFVEISESNRFLYGIRNKIQ
jgi:hypothetical protein